MKKIVITILLCACAAINADTFVTAASLDFEGLQNISRNDIIYHGQIAVKDGKFIINREKLSGFLGNESLIKKYKLIDKNGTLCIIVEEQKADFCILIENTSGNRLAVLNEKNAVVSKGRAVEGIPLVLVPQEYFTGSESGEELAGFLELFREIRGKYSVWNQIQTLELDYDSLKIRCFSRKTEFTIENSASGFYKLNSIVAYLDRTGYYPERLNLTKNLTVIK